MRRAESWGRGTRSPAAYTSSGCVNSRPGGAADDDSCVQHLQPQGDYDELSARRRVCLLLLQVVAHPRDIVDGQRQQQHTQRGGDGNREAQPEVQGGERFSLGGVWGGRAGRRISTPPAVIPRSLVRTAAADSSAEHKEQRGEALWTRRR